MGKNGKKAWLGSLEFGAGVLVILITLLLCSSNGENVPEYLTGYVGYVTLLCSILATELILKGGIDLLISMIVDIKQKNRDADLKNL